MADTPKVWDAPRYANGGIDWHAMPNALPARTPDTDFRALKQKREDLEMLAKLSEDMRRAEEAKTEREKLTRGLSAQSSHNEFCADMFDVWRKLKVTSES